MKDCTIRGRGHICRASKRIQGEGHSAGRLELFQIKARNKRSFSDYVSQL